MTSVRIVEAFTAYPDGVKRTFRVGETVDLEPEFAAAMVAKGLAICVGGPVRAFGPQNPAPLVGAGALVERGLARPDPAPATEKPKRTAP